MGAMNQGPTGGIRRRLRVYANVSCSAGQPERQVLGKAIGSGSTRSRPEADLQAVRLRSAKAAVEAIA
jgi:hypothetical protein